MDTKQVIIWRNDLKVRTGKKMAQGSHASMAFLTKQMFRRVVNDDCHYDYSELVNNDYEEYIKDEIFDWLQNSFKKIVCYVNSEEELDELHQKALEKGLLSNLIIDNGATEFNGVKTKTCLAIGPAKSEKFVGLTDHLPLL